jgi:tetratricopeptide (TPR) repeat protein
MKLSVLIVFCLCLTFEPRTYAATDSLLNELNTALANKEHYVVKKQQRIDVLKTKLSRTGKPEDRYNLYQSLYDEYKTFQYDSAYNYAKQADLAAVQLHNPVLIASAKMKVAFSLISAGMFKETLETLNNISLNNLTDSSKAEYYFLKARSYFDLSDFDHNNDYTWLYVRNGTQCIDSGLAVSKAGTYRFLSLHGLKDLRTGNFPAAVKDYTAILKLPNLTANQYAISACSLSYVYESQGKKDEAVALLIKAAIADLQSATKETVAIYKLADFLYKQGDLNNAFVYIKQAMDDATYYGARHRQVTISSIMPIIEAKRIKTIEEQRRSLFIYSSIITVLVFFVIAFAIIIFRQLKKLRIADNIIKATNITLQDNNKSLEELNKNLSVANKIKNEYIGYYFNVNSIYIEKLENFQKSLDKKLTSKRYEDAHVTVKSLNLESERQHLFDTFDKVFLKLFPNFITKFNELFTPEEEIGVPTGQLLSTEHRIFALIRMGIHDNDRIAKLLGYSVNTIYAYKNRIKNRSFVSNDEFENRIMEIEAV